MGELASSDCLSKETPAEQAPSVAAHTAPLDGRTPDPEFEAASQSAAAPPPDVALYAPGNEQQCRRLLDEAVAADPRTFVSGDRNGPLVVLRIPKQELLPPDTSWLGDLPGTSLALPPDIVERAEKVPWYRRGKNELVRIHAPRALANDYLIQMRGRYSAAVLVGIARVPAIALDGTIHSVQGHDAQTGLYFDRLVRLDIPEKVSHDEARAAAEQLLLPFSEYKLSDPSSAQALLLALTLTALRRPFLPAAPLFVASSSMPGTGKGKLMRSVSHLAFGTAPVTLTWGGNGEEFEKRLASVMLQTPAALNVDNANGMMVSGDLLESLITEGAADIRPLGRSETIRVRNRSFLCLTGNNPIITGDMARRTLVLHVVPRSADPERDRYAFDPVDMVTTRRTELLQFAYTIMRGFRHAGMPDPGLPAVGSFEVWSREVRDLVYWLTKFDVSEYFGRNKAEDPRRQNDTSLLAALFDHFGMASFRAADAVSVHKAVVDHQRTPHMFNAPTASGKAVHDGLEEVLGGRNVNAKLFGHWARRIKGAHLGRYVLETHHDLSSNTNSISVTRK